VGTYCKDDGHHGRQAYVMDVERQYHHRDVSFK